MRVRLKLVLERLLCQSNNECCCYQKINDRGLLFTEYKLLRDNPGTKLCYETNTISHVPKIITTYKYKYHC